jgi:hypothetical protein
MTRCSPRGCVLGRPRTLRLLRYAGSLRPFLGTTIASRRRATFRQTLLAALLVVLAAAGCGGSGDEIPALPAGSFVTANGSIGPSIHLFGDTITSELDVVVDKSRLDPDRVSVKTFFAPYKAIGKTQVARSDAGNLTHLSYRTRYRCLERSCLTSTLGTITNPEGAAPRTFRFRPGEVRYTDPGAKDARLLRVVRFAPVEAVTRINAQDVTQVYGFPFRGSFTPVPELTQRVSPTTLALVLLLLAVLLLVLPAVLIARWVRARRQPPPPEPAPEPTPLERAIALVEWSLTRENGAERRAALDALATELDTLEANGLADETRVAAWSPRSPSPSDATSILTQVKERHDDA